MHVKTLFSIKPYRRHFTLFFISPLHICMWVDMERFKLKYNAESSLTNGDKKRREISTTFSQTQLGLLVPWGNSICDTEHLPLYTFCQIWVPLSLSSICCITSALSSIENKDRLRQWLWDYPRDCSGRMDTFLRLTLTRPSVTVIWEQNAKTNMMSPQTHTSVKVLQTV